MDGNFKRKLCAAFVALLLIALSMAAASFLSKSQRQHPLAKLSAEDEQIKSQASGNAKQLETIKNSLTLSPDGSVSLSKDAKDRLANLPEDKLSSLLQDAGSGKIDLNAILNAPADKKAEQSP